MLPVAHEVRHLEEPELVDLRRHDRGGQGEVHRAELDLLQKQFVATELTGAVGHDLPTLREALVRASGELVGGQGEERAGLAHVPEEEVAWRGGVRRAAGQADER